MKDATYFHAGCPVCVDAEQSLIDELDGSVYTVERVNLGEQRGRIAEARAAGVTSVPVLVVEGQPYHINHGATLDEVAA
ncbi:MAG: thioredoxin family protein [Miltoncostaeaceae bacterium]